MNLERLRYWFRQQPTWLNHRRRQREGWSNVWQRLRWWPKILKTRPLRTTPHRPGASVEVHMICHERDWQLALWALKSFYFHAQCQYPLVIHLQSQLQPWAEQTLRDHLPDARILTSAEAGALVVEHLVQARLPRCLALRYATSFMPKLLDIEILSWSTNVITFDADILFFRRPTEMLVAGSEPVSFQMFQQDIFDNYNDLTYEQAERDLGVRLVPLINTGMTVRPSHGLDLRRIEFFGSHPVAGRPSGHTEQTLHALAASEQGAVRFLPQATYTLALDGAMDCSSLVCRHYAGPSKPWLAREGMPYLAATGFLSDLAK